MKSLNKVQIIGNVGREPELRYTASGSAVANISIAVNEKYKGADGEMKERVDWISCTAWTKLAEIVQQYVKKGDPIYIEGRLHIDKYEKDGQTRYASNVVIDHLIMLGGKRNGEAPATEDPMHPTTKPDAKEEDGLPF